MCVLILRSIGTKLTNLENMKKSYVYLTSRDAKTVRRTSYGLDTPDRYFDHDHFEPNQKSIRLPIQKLGFKRWFDDLDLWPMLYFLLYVTHTGHDVLESQC